MPLALTLFRARSSLSAATACWTASAASSSLGGIVVNPTGLPREGRLAPLCLARAGALWESTCWSHHWRRPALHQEQQQRLQHGIFDQCPRPQVPPRVVQPLQRQQQRENQPRQQQRENQPRQQQLRRERLRQQRVVPILQLLQLRRRELSPRLQLRPPVVLLRQRREQLPQPPLHRPSPRPLPPPNVPQGASALFPRPRSGRAGPAPTGVEAAQVQKV
jgi:hypothetical protein